MSLRIDTNMLKNGVHMVVAATKNQFGIGNKGNLPWHLPSDMKYFKKITISTQDSSKQNAVIMGRKTWESIPEKFRPLTGRLNIVLSRNPNVRLPDEVLVAPSLNEAMEKLQQVSEKIESVYIIGGGSIYQQALDAQLCTKIFLTEIESPEFECDTFCPIDAKYKFKCVSSSDPITENDTTFRFQVLERQTSDQQPEPQMSPGVSEPVHEEMQYLNLIQEILARGAERGDRTGTGTLSIFGAQMRFSLRDNVLPLLTTKRVFWRGVAEELLWFISGDTNAKTLQDKNIRIWDGNGSREYLDSIGHPDREVGDLGPVYGFQWRHFGAKYTNMHADYTGQGIDQLGQLIEKIKTNPNDRRLILSAWNPADLSLMALPPCHMFCQFYVANGELSCQMYQRSADMGLGVPFNIASYALLTRMIAQVTGLKAGDFVHVIGDAHVYTNHVEPLKEQLKREPRPFPVLHINPEKKNIDDFVFDDFTVEGYLPHKKIEMTMAI